MTILSTPRNACSDLLKEQVPPCYSFFFRLHSGSEKQIHDEGHILSRCREAILSTAHGAEAEKLIAAVQSLIDQIDYTSGAKSVSLYVSGGQSSIFHHFVNLPERWYVANEFSLLEYLWATQASRPYLLLVPGASQLKAYVGQADHLVSMEPSRELQDLMNSYKHKAKSHASGESETAELMRVVLCVEKIAALCSSKNLPLLLMGEEFLPGCVKELRAKDVAILQVLSNNCDGLSPEELHPGLEKVLSELFLHAAEELIVRCETAQGQNRLASGVQEIVECARDGRGALLLLELPTWGTNDGKPDPENTAIRDTLKNGGEVKFVAAGMLTRWTGAALILRY